MNKNFYLYAMFLVLFITAAYCIFSFSNVDLLGGVRSSDIDIGDGFSPIVEGNYEHKGTKSNPLSLYEDNDIIYREMLKSIHNGERDFYLDVENRSSSEIKKRLEEIKSFYLTANQAIYPTLIGVCSYRYEYLSGGSFVLFTLSDIGESGNGVKNGYKDYQKLCKYVKEDIRDLYDNGT